ncbi:hypothetical protein CHARACLAT_019182 [Characodon lateralis]|uniref:Uncharacterized protein n=1 Tax=Characodon lateralis TaxID=208331 RepID=A0ABU7CSV6_9TELE|nr:hypothetical protein [Characodon lateralis]
MLEEEDGIKPTTVGVWDFLFVFACYLHYLTTRCRLSSGGERETSVRNLHQTGGVQESSRAACLRLSVCLIWLRCRSVLVQLARRLNCFPSFKISRKGLDSIPAGCY